MMLLDEIFMEVYRPKEFLQLEISLPGNEYEFGYEQELDAIGKRIQECLNAANITGIKANSVTRSKDAELVLELQEETAQVVINKRRGDIYRDRIGYALANNCKGLFSSVHVEGATGVNNRLNTPLGPRNIDIRMIDSTTGKPVNIELKRGASRYHSSQKTKDAYIATNLKQGQTYVVRGTPKTRR